MRLVARIRLARIARGYRRIVRTELRLRTQADRLEAAALRRDFAAETVGIINQGQRRQGIPRHERRRFMRQLAKGR